MKRLIYLTLILIGIIANLSLHAQIIAYEGFNYFNNNSLALHNCNTNSPNTNLATSLGWGGDWTVSGNNTNIPGYNITTTNSPVYTAGGNDLLNTGRFLVAGNSSQTAGRRLQVSTAGAFATNGTNYITTSHPSTSGRIGRNSTTLWLGFLIRKNTNNDEPVFIALHRNTTITDVNSNNRIAIGYFGTDSNNSGSRFWSIRINGTVTRSSVAITANQFTLIVVRIDFNASSGNRNTVRMYVNPTSIGGSAPATENLLVQTSTAQDHSFNTFAFYGGNNSNQSALDEVRFANSYAGATLASDKINIAGGLCSGVVGANIFANGDFGVITGNNEIAATASTWTNPGGVVFKDNIAPWNGLAPGYSYIANTNAEPNDGRYTIANAVRSPFGNINSSSTPFWLSTNDRSGTNNGFMMIVNASFNPGIFYEETISGLCENTRYEFSADVINLYSAGIASLYTPNGLNASFFPRCNPVTEPGCQQLYINVSTQPTTATGNCSVGGDCRRYSILPDIEFLINDVVVYSPPRPIDNDGAWKNLGFTFTTKSNVNQLKLSIRNKAPGGIGNDIALDNITFSPCGPSISANDQLQNCADPRVVLTLGPEFNTPVYQWQKSSNNGVTWTNLPGATQNQYVPAAPAKAGDRLRVLIANSAANLVNGNCQIQYESNLIGCALPARIQIFRAYVQSRTIQLNWQGIANDSKKFIVQKSSNGQDFESIGVVEVDPKRDSGQEFGFLDDSPQSGLNYYRLQQINQYSQSIYSDIISVRFNNPEMAAIQLNPNPLKSGENLQLKLALLNQKNIHLQIFDSFGKLVQTESLASGEQQIGIKLSAGVYYLHFISTQGLKKVERLVVL
ncbi:MAG: T9SS type A sorting domain-containing protein [Microscillaceae bacterium]|jgi:hypothetical protein|nr:T9SS type A sorting domain-containing protein [Microscillaceae bacterium]